MICFQLGGHARAKRQLYYVQQQLSLINTTVVPLSKALNTKTCSSELLSDQL